MSYLVPTWQRCVGVIASHTHAHTLLPPHTDHTQTHTLPPTHARSHAHTHTHIHAHSLDMIRSNTHCTRFTCRRSKIWMQISCSDSQNSCRTNILYQSAFHVCTSNNTTRLAARVLRYPPLYPNKIANLIKYFKL